MMHGEAGKGDTDIARYIEIYVVLETFKRPNLPQVLPPVKQWVLLVQNDFLDATANIHLHAYLLGHVTVVQCCR